MQITSTLALLASTVSLTTAFHLPDGAWLTTRHANGSLTGRDLYNPEARSFLVEDEAAAPVERRTTVAKRDTLDATGVDLAVQDLKAWAGLDHGLESGTKNNAVYFTRNGMITYYCIDAKHASVNLDVNDVNYALAQMDGTCQRYEASYFKWPGSVEIVGKGRSDDRVCV